MRVRRGCAGDLAKLVEIETACFGEAAYTPMTRRQFRHHLTSDRAVLTIAEDVANTPVGYALGLLHAQRPFVRFYSLAVAPVAQGGEAGRLLFASIEEAARSRRLGVQCEIRQDNEKLEKRYRGLGYRVYRVVSDYYPDGQACLKMIKPFADRSDDF